MLKDPFLLPLALDRSVDPVDVLWALAILTHNLPTYERCIDDEMEARDPFQRATERTDGEWREEK